MDDNKPTKTLRQYLDEIEEEKKNKAPPIPVNLNAGGGIWGYVDIDDDPHARKTYAATYSREYTRDSDATIEIPEGKKKCSHKNTKMVQMIYTSFKLCKDCKEEVK